VLVSWLKPESEGESPENALRRFKRKVQRQDIIKEVKRRCFYLKPGEKHRSRKPWHAQPEKARKEQD
jgi:small subunit ribosomal protein S21